MWPAEGRPRDVVGPILDTLFPDGARSRITIAVVTGTGNTCFTARLLAHVLSSCNTTVGLASTDGVFVNNARRADAGLDGPSAMRLLFLDPGVDMAVVELSPESVLKHGLGYDRSDVCAVVNDKPLDSSVWTRPLDLMVSATRRSLVVAAESESIRAMAAGSDVGLWHVQAQGREPPGGTAEGWVTLAGGAICARNQRRVIARIPLANTPWMNHDGRLTQSASYAVAMALSLGYDPGDITRGLDSFASTDCLRREDARR